MFERLEPKLVEWIERQRLFFVGTAPLGAHGHVNISPKGPIDTLRVLDERRIAYLDYAGSGAETIAHLNENGRVVVMLCAFEGPPRIVRLHGRGTVHQLGTPEFDELYEGERPQQLDWIDRKLRTGPGAISDYMTENNATSIDGLPALDLAETIDRP